MAEETILTGEDLMLGPPSPRIPPELATDMLKGMRICAEELRTFFQCLHEHEVEPFCQDEIIQFRKCSQERDQLLRQKLVEAETKFSGQLSEKEALDRLKNLESAAELLERRLLLASGIEGFVGFQQRWKFHGELQDIRKRLDVVERQVKILENLRTKSVQKKGWNIFGS